MKNNLLTLTLIAVISLFIAGTNRTIEAPCQPTKTIVQDFRTVYGLEKEMKDYIYLMTQKGSIAKDFYCAMLSNPEIMNHSSGFPQMELIIEGAEKFIKILNNTSNPSTNGK